MKTVKIIRKFTFVFIFALFAGCSGSDGADSNVNVQDEEAAEKNTSEEENTSEKEESSNKEETSEGETSEKEETSGEKNTSEEENTSEKEESSEEEIKKYYTVSYELFGGSFSGETTAQYNESEKFNLPSPQKAGLTFLKWYAVPGVDGKKEFDAGDEVHVSEDTVF